MQQPASAPATEQASPPVLTVEGARATIRLNRPRHLNRLQPEDLQMLMELFDRIEGDYFAILGLGRDASAHEVARAFERLKREFAPDRFADPLRQELSDALSEIGEVLDELGPVQEAEQALRALRRRR